MGPNGARQPDVAEVSLADVRDLPLVAAAIAAAPTEWGGTTWAYGEAEPVDASASLEELLDWIWVEADDGVWSLSLGEELKPLVDLDADEEDDPVLMTLLAEHRVHRAYHEDRELYCVEVTSPLSVEDAAALFLRALTRGHEALAAAPRPLPRP
jgi:hypothetical protein